MLCILSTKKDFQMAKKHFSWRVEMRQAKEHSRRVKPFDTPDILMYHRVIEEENSKTKDVESRWTQVHDCSRIRL
jgi:hypothetical protein